MRRLIALCCALTLFGAPPIAAAPRAEPPDTTRNPLLAAPHALRFSADAHGHVRITRAALLAAGWPSTLSLTHVRVWRAGQELAAVRHTESLMLAVIPSERRSTLAASYWLTLDDAPGLTAAHLPQTRISGWELDALYWPTLPSARGDRWFAGELQDTVALTVTLDLATPLPAGAPFQLTLAAPAMTEHEVLVFHAGSLLARVPWPPTPGAAVRTITAPLLQPLPAGRVALELQRAAPGAALLLDRLDLPNGQSPLPALPAPALLPPVRSAVSAADVVLLAAPPLWPALQPLVAAHQQRGAHAALVDPQALYDTYSFGERDPEAIRSFVRATRGWSTVPRSVVLVGAGTSWLRRSSAEDSALLIPPYLIDGDQKYGELACDTCYGRVSSTDPLLQPVPDVMIGRLPARDPAEAAALATKTARALLEPAVAAWQSRALLLADNDTEADGTADLAGPFTPQLDRARQALAGFTQQTLRYAPLAAEPGYRSAAALRRDLFNAWDAGAAVVVYAGHGSPWQWGYTAPTEPVSQLLGDSDVAALRNAERLPLLLSLTCRSGAWHNPWRPTLEETALRLPHGGALAALSSGGAASAAAYASLAAALLEPLRAGASLGAAQRAAQQTLGNHAATRELVFSLNLLGDPDLTLPFVPHSQIIVPLVGT